MTARLLGMFAHPDDEVFCMGGSLAKYAAAGAITEIVSATRGEAGQIRDASVATRQTLGSCREAELAAGGAALGVTATRCLDYRDGTLAGVDRASLVADIVEVIRTGRPDVVVTFGSDGAYGHPDHVAVGEATTEAVLSLVTAGDPDAPGRLYHSHFPRSRLLLTERLADWLVRLSDWFQGRDNFAQALTLFAEESTTLRYASDHVDVQWFPPGMCIVEEGEPARSLHLILSGRVAVSQLRPDGGTIHLRTMVPGQFFGELGIIGGGVRTATVVAEEPVTCLVLSMDEPTVYAGPWRRGGAHRDRRSAGHRRSDDRRRRQRLRRSQVERDTRPPIAVPDGCRRRAARPARGHARARVLHPDPPVVPARTRPAAVRIPVRISVWLLHVAAPLFGLWLLVARPMADVVWEDHPAHFWLVLTTAVVNVGIAVVMNVESKRRADARLFLVSLGFATSAGFLALHALATPGLLFSLNTGFIVATPVGLLITSVLRCLVVIFVHAKRRCACNRGRFGAPRPRHCRAARVAVRVAREDPATRQADGADGGPRSVAGPHERGCRAVPRGRPAVLAAVPAQAVGDAAQRHHRIRAARRGDGCCRVRAQLARVVVGMAHRS